MFSIIPSDNRFFIYDNNNNPVFSLFNKKNAEDIIAIINNDINEEISHIWDKVSSNEHFLVIDGSSILATAYYGTLPKSILYAKTEADEKAHYSDLLHTSTGIYTNAVYTMLKSIFKIINNQKPTHIVVAFDKSRETTFRRKMYAEYKNNRKPTPEPLKSQMKLMQDILDTIGIKTLISDEFEADDLAGSVIEKFKSSIPMEFMTKDHDYLQLTDKNAKAWMVQTSKENTELLWDKYGDENKSYIEANLPDKVIDFTEDITLAEIGVSPEQIVDYKAIAGDSSDNIPGVKGVGPKTAIALLGKYQTLDRIYAVIDACKSDISAEKKLAAYWKNTLGIKRSPIKMFKEQRDMAYLSRDLATIRTNVDIPYSLDDFKINIDMSKLKDVLETYEFGSLFDNDIIGWNQLLD